MTPHPGDPTLRKGFPLSGAHRERSSGRRTAGSLPFSLAATSGADVSVPHRREKRPYVRPRIGNSIFRSLWYVFAFGGLLVIAFLLPRSQVSERSVEGDWQLEAEVSTGGLPVGAMTLLTHGGHYTLRFETEDGGTGIELGRLVQRDGQIEMIPVNALTVDGSGAGHSDRPQSRTFSIRFENDRMILTDASGATLIGTPYSFEEQR